MDDLQIIQDLDKSIEVMHNVGVWMKKTGLNPSIWWEPENMNRQFLLKHTEPEEFYVAVEKGKPAASMVLQETERNQSWKYVDGAHPLKSLYLHWLAVHRNFAGRGFSRVMVEFATKEARRRGHKRLRLDTNADEEKLCKLYESLGFKLMGIEQEKDRKTAYFQMVLQ